MDTQLVPPSVTVVPPAPAVRPPSLAQLVRRDKRRRRRRALGLGIGAAALIAAAVTTALLTRPRPTPLAARFRVQPVTEGDVLRDVRATGQVEAVTTVSVGAEISGRIATVEGDYNQKVRAGQVLARFDRNALEAQRAQAQATAAAARAAVAQAQFDADQALRNLSRAEGLWLRKAMSEQDHDTAVTAARLAQSRLHAAEAQLEAQNAALALTATNLTHAVIRSPIDGVVITRNVEPGQTVASMLQTPVLFTVAADLRKMRVIAAIDEADVGEVAVGQLAASTVSGYPDRVFEGVVTEVRNSPKVVQDIVTYGTVVAIANPDLALRPGMTATVRIRVAEARGVRRVPSQALRFTPPGERADARPAVWILEGERLHRVAVTPGISDGELTAIGAGDALAPGAQVLLDLTPAGRKAYGLERKP